jgi:hypothetical protein
LPGGEDLADEVIIGNNIQIGENAIVLPCVEIGDNCVIGANAVAYKAVPPGTVAAGVPVKNICAIEKGLARWKPNSNRTNIFLLGAKWAVPLTYLLSCRAITKRKSSDNLSKRSRNS